MEEGSRSGKQKARNEKMCFLVSGEEEMASFAWTQDVCLCVCVAV